MDILNSAWLINMLQKSSKKPQQRLLSLFDVLADWINAPHIRESLSLPLQEPSSSGSLLNFLTEQAKTSGAKLPEALAQQLYFIALGALHEELRNPGTATISHAKIAAQALINAQTQREPVSKPVKYGVAAGLMLAIVTGALLLNIPTQASHVVIIQPAQARMALQEDAPGPAHTAEMYAVAEQMRKGTCQFPEALQLPDSEKTVYMENVVGGQATTNAKDEAIVKKLMEKVRCNYTPMLMANSTG